MSTDEQFAIWSNEHQRWWRSSRFGYTERADEAGLYDRDEAAGIRGDASYGWRRSISGPPEVLVPAALMRLPQMPPEQVAALATDAARQGWETREMFARAGEREAARAVACVAAALPSKLEHVPGSDVAVVRVEMPNGTMAAWRIDARDLEFFAEFGEGAL